MESRMIRRLACLLLVFVLAATSGCALFRRDKPERDPSETAQRLARNADRALEQGNFQSAIGGYESLVAIHPFSEQARQAQISLMYAYWRNDEPEAAIIAADRFILENPTHPRVDYALYMKGLSMLPRDPGPMERLFRVDLNKRPPGEMQRAFNTFAQLLQQHPESEYGPDARQRMIYLRNRLAAHEVYVADFYVRRNAYVAALNRARHVVEAYQETPSVVPALEVMATAYDRLGLADLAADTRRVIAANEPARR
jgi:outer membrane protein assembly factor BamD